MTDHDALVAAICADPDEDTPRLAYADFLQENGEPERAEFVRAQIDLARTPAWEPFAVLCKWRRLDWFAGIPFRSALPPVDGFQLEWHPQAFRRGLGSRLNVRSLVAWDQVSPALLDRAPLGELHLWAATLDDWQRFAESPVLPRLRKLHFVNSPIEPLRVLRDVPEVLGITDLYFDRASGAGMPVVIEELLQSRLGNAVRGLHFHMGYQSLDDLVDAIGPAYELQRLSLRTMGLTEPLVGRLMSLGVARNLTQLDMSGSPLGGDGLELLANGLPLSVESLQLSGTGAVGNGLRAIVFTSRVVNLRHLDLSQNPLAPRETKMLSESRPLSRLRSVTLRQCRIGDKGMRHITRAKFWRNLVELDLRDNPISVGGIRHLLDAPVPPDLTALVLSINQLGNASRSELRRKYGEAVVFAADA